MLLFFHITHFPYTRQFLSRRNVGEAVNWTPEFLTPPWCTSEPILDHASNDFCVDYSTLAATSPERDLNFRHSARIAMLCAEHLRRTSEEVAWMGGTRGVVSRQSNMKGPIRIVIAGHYVFNELVGLAEKFTKNFIDDQVWQRMQGFESSWRTMLEI